MMVQLRLHDLTKQIVDTYNVDKYMTTILQKYCACDLFVGSMDASSVH